MDKSKMIKMLDLSIEEQEDKSKNLEYAKMVLGVIEQIDGNLDSNTIFYIYMKNLGEIYPKTIEVSGAGQFNNTFHTLLLINILNTLKRIERNGHSPSVMPSSKATRGRALGSEAVRSEDEGS